MAVVVVLGIAVGGAGQGLAYEANPDAWKWTWRAFAALGALLAAGAPLIDRKRRENAVQTLEDAVTEERTAQTVRLNDALDPLVETLADVVEGRDPKAAVQALIKQALASASNVIGPDRTRACYFKVQDLPNHSAPIVVSPLTSTGRYGKPRSTFVQGTPAGDAVVQMLIGDEALFCPDVEAEPPPGWETTQQRDYRTFISAPVRVGRTVYGFISVDAPEPGDLLESDVPFLRVMGTVIAVGLQITDQRADMESKVSKPRRKPSGGN